MTSTTPIQGQIAAVDVSTYNPNHVQPEYRDLIKAVEAVNSTKSNNLNNESSHFKLRLDTSNRTPVIDVVAKDGETVLYQIPPQRFLDYAKSLEDGRNTSAAAVYVPSGESQQT